MVRVDYFMNMPAYIERSKPKYFLLENKKWKRVSRYYVTQEIHE